MTPGGGSYYGGGGGSAPVPSTLGLVIAARQVIDAFDSDVGSSPYGDDDWHARLRSAVEELRVALHNDGQGFVIIREIE